MQIYITIDIDTFQKEMKNEIERKYNNKDIKDIIDLSSKEYIILLNTRSFDEKKTRKKGLH